MADYTCTAATDSCGSGISEPHHDFTPDESSWGMVVDWLEERASESDKKNHACPACENDLYADFLLCPTEPYKKGSVQRAKVISAIHRLYVHAKE
jgi:hypothetical protein